MLSEKELTLIKDVDQQLRKQYEEIVETENRLLDIVEKIQEHMHNCLKDDFKHQAEIQSAINSLPQGFFRSELRTEFIDMFVLDDKPDITVKHGSCL